MPSGMRLREALERIQQGQPESAAETRYLLACSSTPAHLKTLLHAHLLDQVRGSRIEVATIPYGDLIGGLERFEPKEFMGAAVFCEWYDLDPRLGFRRLGGWSPRIFPEIVAEVEAGFDRLKRVLERISGVVPTVVALPTLPLPPVELSIPEQSVGRQSQLWSVAWDFAKWCVAKNRIRLLSSSELDRRSPHSERFDLRGEISHGSPYQLAHMSVLAEMMSRVLVLSQPLKGLITDLDDTLWSGMLGEVGVANVAFSLDTDAQLHGLYQQFLQSLAERGVLIAIASKNDHGLVEQALQRTDLLVDPKSLFPIEAHWGSKSESVARILKTWNVGADTVVFVDDSPLEAAEIQSTFPEMRTLEFPKNDPARLLDVFHTLQSWFGKPTLRVEDSIRVQTIERNAISAASVDACSRRQFLEAIEPQLRFQLSRDDTDDRAFELINKTNQFNLNGQRLSELEWRNLLSDPATFLLAVTYHDKFGPLGKIAAVLGRRVRSEAEIKIWVMSCRAFSRLIEHATIRYMFDRLDVDRISFALESTERNAPLRAFFSELKIAEASPSLSRTDFNALCPRLPHMVEGMTAHA